MYVAINYNIYVLFVSILLIAWITQCAFLKGQRAPKKHTYKRNAILPQKQQPFDGTTARKSRLPVVARRPRL